MRAWQVQRLGRPVDALELVELPSSPLIEGQVRVRVEHAALNFLDVLLCAGAYGAGNPQPPFVPGVEAAGTVVEAAGTDVVSAGDRVVIVPAVGAATLAEEVVVSAADVFPLRQGVGTAAGACLMVTYQTAWVGLHRLARLAADEIVLVHAGAGGVGTATIQLAVSKGARVVATAGTEVKRQLCRELGAELAVDYRAEDFVKPVLDHTDGDGVDVVVDPVGGDVFTRSLDCLALEGRLVTAGFAAGTPIPLDVEDLAKRNIAVMGVAWGVHYPGRRPILVRQIYDRLVDLMDAGDVRPVIWEERSFEEAPEALAALGDGHTSGKVVIRM